MYGASAGTIELIPLCCTCLILQRDSLGEREGERKKREREREIARAIALLCKVGKQHLQTENRNEVPKQLDWLRLSNQSADTIFEPGLISWPPVTD